MHLPRERPGPPGPAAPVDVPAIRILEALPIGVLLASADGCIRWANATAGELLATAPAGLVGRNLAGLPARRRLRLSKTTDKLRLTTASGHNRWLECIVQRTGDEDCPIVACLTDVTSYESRHRILTSAGGRPGDQFDRVTGLLSRGAIEHELAVQVSRSRRYRNPLSLVMLRIGRAAPGLGNVTPFDKHRPARMIARTLREKLRWVDVVGAWAPDEFLLVLPETSIHSARQLVRKLRTQLQAVQQGDGGLLAGRPIAISASEWRATDDPGTLVERVCLQLAVADGPAGGIATG